ncbi:Uncharacterized protein APZ42_022817 [Daphnia magna]|uniref:Gustatory receptor n=1 Tax=Daphnia magna TaxID=35525 RepID=A0A162C835_9CRUS|nr:Uncharacterized protein APZ42_022817 [Daphnia magna]
MDLTAMVTSIETNLWPLLVGLRIFGFHMGSSKKPSEGSRYSICLTVVGSLMVLSTVVIHCTSFVCGVMRLKANGIGTNGTNLTTANLLNIGIEHLNYTWVLIGVHVTFFFVSLTSNWTTLWDSLLLIERDLKLNSTFHRKCKKSVSIGFCFLLIDCVSHLLISIRSFYWDMGVLSPLAIVLSNVSRTTIVSVFLLFCVLVRVIMLVFQTLNDQIAHLDETDQFPSLYLTSRVLNIRLEKWRRNHTLACELVEMVNQCFGIVMLVTVVNVFISFITTTFEIVRSMQDDATIPVLFTVIFIKKSILLSIIIYEPYRLQSEVYISKNIPYFWSRMICGYTQAARTAVSLRKLQPSTADLLTQIKLNTVVIEVTHAGPKITAMEFFDVNRRLLPTLIGSTLTYVAILCQASSNTHPSFK